MLEFEETLAQLGGTTAGNLTHFLDLYQSGYITRDTFVSLSLDTLDLATRQGAYYGQLSYAEIRALYLDLVPDYARVIDPEKQAGQPRSELEQAVETILNGDPEQIDTRLERLGLNVAISSVQDSYQSELQGDSEVTGWTRGLDSGACQLCHFWHRSGRVWPRDHPMPTHTNCKCQQVPVYGGDTPKDTHLLRDRRHREFLDSLTDEERAYYDWAKAVRDEYAKALRTGVKYVDLDSLPAPPAGVMAMVPPANPKIQLRGLEYVNPE